jgi:regulator of sirC expression with transglutaminase-like and TPR domain
MCRVLARLLVAMVILGLPSLGLAFRDVGIVQPSDSNIGVLRALIKEPEGQVDFAKAKIAIDHMIDPKVDEYATLKMLDAWAYKVRLRIPPHASNMTKLLVLGSTLYQPGPWNDYKPFLYDLDDPLGKNIKNKLILNYMVTRKGNCVSMPMLFLILGQKIGLDMTLSVAPNHNFVKFHQDDGTWLNIETTSGTSMSNGDYQRNLHITPLGMRSGIYLRPLSQKEVLGVMMGTLESFYAKHRSPEYQLTLTALALEINPKDTVSIIRRADAYYRLLQQRYVHRYPRAYMIPPALRDDFKLLSKKNLKLFHQAEALGWHQPTADEDAEYLKEVQEAKLKRRN